MRKGFPAELVCLSQASFDQLGTDRILPNGVEEHPFTVVGVTPPGFFGETLRGDPPDLWIPIQKEPLISGDSSLLRQPIAATLVV